LFGLVAGLSTWAAFSDTTANAGNVFTAGTVDIDDNDSGTALYDNFDGTPEGKPTSSETGCIKVTFNGSLDSSVELYGSNNLNANALDDQLTLQITSGSGDTINCSDFDQGANADGNVYNGSLANFMTTYNGWGDNLDLNAGGNAVWSNGEAVTYEFVITLADDADVNLANKGNVSDDGPTGYSTGSHTFTWEARNN
jgi:predicted ribosomally synthesized peptide with SipW-like signal peptide